VPQLFESRVGVVQTEYFELLCRQFPALPFREKLGENNGMIHGPITRCIYQCCPATGHLPQVLYRRMLRFQFVAVTALEFSESVRTMIEPSSQCRRRRDFLVPEIDGSRILPQSARPQPIY
jgi:hypothetical protein